MKKIKTKIILASASPRRKELLERTGYEFRIQVSDADEDVEERDPFRLVEILSRRKALAVAGACLKSPGTDAGLRTDKDPEKRENTGQAIRDDKVENVLVIGADTIVVLDGKILGKPKDEAAAWSMLKKLSGRTHQVCTGVTLIRISDGRISGEDTFHETTRVMMRDLTEEEIGDYIATGDPMDKAGAYGIQGMAGCFIPEIQGDYYNVVGMPLSALVVHMRKLL